METMVNWRLAKDKLFDLCVPKIYVARQVGLGLLVSGMGKPGRRLKDFVLAVESIIT